MMNIDTNTTVINFQPKIPEFKHIRFDLGRAYALHIPELKQSKIGVIPNLLFEQKQEEWRQRDLKREHRITETLEELDKTSWQHKDRIKIGLEKTDGQFKLETVRRYVSEVSKNPPCGCSNYDALHDIWEDKAKNNSVFWDPKKDGCHIEPAQKMGLERSIFDKQRITG